MVSIQDKALTSEDLKSIDLDWFGLYSIGFDHGQFMALNGEIESTSDCQEVDCVFRRNSLTQGSMQR